MSGEQWTQVFQLGREVTEGSPVAATRKLYGNGNVHRERDINMVQISSGTRDNQRDAKVRAVRVHADFTQPLSADEILEWLLLTLKGAVAPVTVLGASTWAFTPTNTLDSATLEFYDGQRNWQMRGTKVNSLKIAGSVGADNVITVDAWGREMIVATQTPALPDRVPDFTEGWESMLYIDAFGATAGTTNIPGTMINWSITINNHLGRKYFADNTTATGSVPLGFLDVTCDLLFEANALALTEYNNRDSATKRLIRLAFGNNGPVLGTSALKKQVTVDIPGVWTVVDLTPEDQGTKVYKFSYQYVYDPTNAYGLQIKAQTLRATAY